MESKSASGCELRVATELECYTELRVKLVHPEFRSTYLDRPLEELEKALNESWKSKGRNYVNRDMRYTVRIPIDRSPLSHALVRTQYTLDHEDRLIDRSADNLIDEHWMFQYLTSNGARRWISQDQHVSMLHTVASIGMNMEAKLGRFLPADPDKGLYGHEMLLRMLRVGWYSVDPAKGSYQGGFVELCQPASKPAEPELPYNKRVTILEWMDPLSWKDRESDDKGEDDAPEVEEEEESGDEGIDIEDGDEEYKQEEEDPLITLDDEGYASRKRKRTSAKRRSLHSSAGVSYSDVNLCSPEECRPLARDILLSTKNRFPMNISWFEKLLYQKHGVHVRHGSNENLADRLDEVLVETEFCVKRSKSGTQLGIAMR